MSKTVDERVVSMQFDNRQFENNVKTSMSTLEKLKQSLNFKDSAKGLESINAAAKNTNLSGLSDSIETVRTKFSAMQVMGITALTNITNTAVNAGKKMVSALTIEPIGDGFKEYEMTLNAIQTTMSATGKTADQVEVELKKLDDYADKTVYSTADMLNNLPKFTNAGVELEVATKSMIGIANATALAGGGASQASIAFYNLGQAIGTGYLTRMDYNSINNAGIATMEWKKQMVEAAIAQGTLTKVGEDSYKAGKKTYSLQQLFIDGLQEQWATTEVMTKVFSDFGDETTEIGKKAYSSAQDIKTFTQLMESLSATAGTGWKDTWELLFGDLDEAKKLWTGISDVVGNFISKTAKARNAILESALGKGFINLSKGMKTVVEPVKKVTKVVSDLGDIVDKVIVGKFGNGKDRFNALSKAGINYYKVQNKVNEKLGNSKRYTEEQIKAQDKLLGNTNKSVKSTKEESKETTKLTKEKKNLLKEMASMTEEQMRSNNVTPEQIKAFKELGETADKLGIPLNEFIDNMDEISGRWLLIEGFKNIGKSILSVFKTIGKAWEEIFPPKSTKEKAKSLFDLIAAFHKFSTTLKMEDNTVDKLRRTFKGLFAILDLITTITGGAFKIAFKVVTSVLNVFGLNILDVTAFIGDAAVGLRDWVNSSLDLGKAISKIIPYLKSFGKSIGDWFAGIKEADNIPGYIVTGLVNGLKNGVKFVVQCVIELGKNILEGIKGVLGIHSPSTEFFEIGKNIILGLVNGIQNGASTVWNVVKTIGAKIIETFSNFDWNSVFAGLISLGMIATVKEIAGAIDTLASPLQGLGDVLSGAGKVLDKSAKGIRKTLIGFSKVLKSFAFSIKAKAIKNIAISIAILVGCIVVLALMDTEKLWEAVAILAALIGVFAMMINVIEKLSTLSSKVETVSFGAISASIAAIGAAMLLMGITLKIIGSLKPEQYQQAIDGMIMIVLSLCAVVATYGLLVQGKAAKHVESFGKMLRKMAVSMLLMAIVLKLLGGMDPAKLAIGYTAILGFVGIITLLTLITKLAGNSFKQLGKTLLMMSTSMLLMTIVIKLLGGMDPAKLAIGYSAILGFVGIIALLTLITKLAGKKFKKLGDTLIQISASMLLMAVVVKLLGGMDPAKMAIGYSAILGFVGVIAVLILVVRILGKDAPKIAATLLAMSVSIAILAGVAILLGLIDLSGLAKGVVAVGILGTVMALMIQATRGANDCKGNLIVMTVAIGIMAAAIAALSMIDPTKLAGATIALSIVMAMFALIVKSGSNVSSSVGSLIVMTLAIGLIGGVLYTLAKLPVDSLLGSAKTLSLVLLSMSAAMFLASKTGPTALIAIVGLAAMGLVVAELALILAMMSALNTQSALQNAFALSVLLGTMSVVLLLIQAVSPTAIVGIVGLAAMGLVVAELALILGLMSKFDVQPSIETALALSILLISMSASLLILGGVGAMAPFVLAGIAALAIMIAGIGGLIIGIGALMQKFPQLESFLDTGIPILQKIGYALGSFVGNIVGGFISSVSSLATLGNSLSQFMTNLAPFINGAKSIDPAVIENVKSLASVIMILTGARLLESITSFLTGGSSISDFAAELVPLGTGLKKFSDSVEGINPSNVTAAANAAKALAEMADAIPNSGGLAHIFAGENSITQFAGELPKLGKGLLMFSLSVEGINPSNITAAANAAKALAEMADVIPNSGGLVRIFAGENSITQFAEELPKLGKGLLMFSLSVEGIKPTNITAAANAAKALAEMADAIPNSGGLARIFAGENSIAAFGDELPKLGKGLKGFSDSVQGIIPENITAAANAAKALAEMADAIPNSGGLARIFAGENSITQFAGELPKLGKGLKGFSDSLVGMNPDNVTAAATAAKALAQMTESAPSDPSKIVKFGEQLAKFGDKLKVYFDKISGISSKSITASSKAVTSVSNTTKNIDYSKLSQASQAIDGLVKSLKGVSSISVESTAGFTSSLKKIGEAGVDSLLKAFKDAESKMTKAGETMINKVVSGAKSKSSTAKKAFQKVVTNCTNKISTDDFKDVGENVVKGFANGISENTWRAEAKSKAMAKAAKTAATKELDENSPSKEFYKIGDFAGLGFVNALGTYEKKSYKVSSDVAKSAKSGLSKTMSNLASLVDMDIDSQPTIRPVLDLSDVSNGVGAINGMFDMQPSVGVMSDVQAVNTMMNRQNGMNNSDLVSEMKGLRSDFAASSNGVVVNVQLDYNAGSDANEIANDIATSLRRAIRRGV